MIWKRNRFMKNNAILAAQTSWSTIGFTNAFTCLLSRHQCWWRDIRKSSTATPRGFYHHILVAEKYCLHLLVTNTHIILSPKIEILSPVCSRKGLDKWKHIIHIRWEILLLFQSTNRLRACGKQKRNEVRRRANGELVFIPAFERHCESVIAIVSIVLESNILIICL